MLFIIGFLYSPLKMGDNLTQLQKFGYFGPKSDQNFKIWCGIHLSTKVDPMKKWSCMAASLYLSTPSKVFLEHLGRPITRDTAHQKVAIQSICHIIIVVLSSWSKLVKDEKNWRRYTKSSVWKWLIPANMIMAYFLLAWVYYWAASAWFGKRFMGCPHCQQMSSQNP
jgi:small-conductance mechanosensitive channel